ncbi:MAG: type IA DNA topoisomerase [Bacillota bacterium]
MELIVAEKPSAAKAIAEALGGFRARQGFLESHDWLLTWAVGHLLELCEPEDYRPEWSKWRLEDLPIVPDFRLRPARGAKERLDVIATLARRSDGLVNACDAAREGELIFRQVVEFLGLRQPVRRLWISSLTREAVRRGFAELRPSAEYDRLHRSAECRSHGDWLVGINATRAFSCRGRAVFSVGRVQTPTLAMIVAREEEINAFTVRAFWEVLAELVTPGGGQYVGRFVADGESRLFDQSAAQAVIDRVAGRSGAVEEFGEKTESENPPLLFDLTSLQREANRRWGMPASSTLAAAQRLYEAKLLTYPRTDSRFLTPDVARTAPRVIDGLAAQTSLASLCAKADPKAIYGHGRVVNARRVADHHAIIPTGTAPGKVSPGDAKVYDLVARRFLAQFFPPATYRAVRGLTRVGDDRFETTARTLTDPGWRTVEPRRPTRAGGEAAKPAEAAESAETSLPGDLRAGQTVICAEASLKAGRTEPPPRFTEGTLLAAMETAGRTIDDEGLREAMKGRGLGTPATRAAIIDRLKQVAYIESAGKQLRPTGKGTKLIGAARAAGAEVLLSPQLTGEWERRINAIQTGDEDPRRFALEIATLAGGVVERVRGWSATGFTASEAETPADLKCPVCGGQVVLEGRAWVCRGQDGQCQFRVGTWILGQRIEVADIEELCRKGKTRLLSGFRSKQGRQFSARLAAGPNGVTFEFAPRRQRRRKAGPAKGKKPRQSAE